MASETGKRGDPWTTKTLINKSMCPFTTASGVSSVRTKNDIRCRGDAQVCVIPASSHIEQ